MNRKEYEEMLEFLTMQADFFNKKVEEFKNLEIEEDSVWELIDGDSYYYISDNGLIYGVKWSFYNTHNDRLSIGNVFRNEEEAKHEVERRKVIAELKRFSRNFKKCAYNYCIKYDVVNKVLSVYNNYYYATGELVFATKKDAENAIKLVGEERILKYYLGVEE